MDEVDVAGLLRRIRRTADLSQRELAAAIGISKSAVAAAEAGAGRLDVRALGRAAACAGLRLALLDAAGAEVEGMADGTVRDMDGRRFPAHVDLRLSDEDWWHGPERYSRPQPWYTFDRDRRRRDARRLRHGAAPQDHLVPQPGDSPAERRAAREAAARRDRRAEWERRRDAGELPPLPAWVCDCPRECDEGDDGTRPFHVDDCACRCDLG